MSFQGKTFQLFLDIVEINKVYWLFTIQFFVPLKAIDNKSTYVKSNKQQQNIWNNLDN